MEMPANITSGCFFVDKLDNPEDPQVELLLQMDHCVLKVPPFSHLLDSNQLNLNLPRSQNKIIDCSQMISGIYSDKYRLNVQECKIQRELGEDDQDDFCQMISLANASQLTAGQRGFSSILNGRKLIIFEFE